MFLAKNPDMVFSKETLFDRVWGTESLGETATVSVHVNRIRDKIETDSAKRSISKRCGAQAIGSARDKV